LNFIVAVVVRDCSVGVVMVVVGDVGVVDDVINVDES
jgi:hypothetical protein